MHILTFDPSWRFSSFNFTWFLSFNNFVSLFINPALDNLGFNKGLNTTNALAIAYIIASLCPVYPPPVT